MQHILVLSNVTYILFIIYSRLLMDHRTIDLASSSLFSGVILDGTYETNWAPMPWRMSQFSLPISSNCLHFKPNVTRFAGCEKNSLISSRSAWNFLEMTFPIIHQAQEQTKEFTNIRKQTLTEIVLMSNHITVLPGLTNDWFVYVDLRGHPYHRTRPHW